MELECALLEYATVQRGRWRDQRRPSVRSPPPHLHAQGASECEWSECGRGWKGLWSMCVWKMLGSYVLNK